MSSQQQVAPVLLSVPVWSDSLTHKLVNLQGLVLLAGIAKNWHFPSSFLCSYLWLSAASFHLLCINKHLSLHPYFYPNGPTSLMQVCSLHQLKTNCWPRKPKVLLDTREFISLYFMLLPFHPYYSHLETTSQLCHPHLQLLSSSSSCSFPFVSVVALLYRKNCKYSLNLMSSWKVNFNFCINSIQALPKWIAWVSWDCKNQ